MVSSGLKKVTIMQKTNVKRSKTEEIPTKIYTIQSQETLYKNGFLPFLIEGDIDNTKRVFGGDIVCCILCIQGESQFYLDATSYTIKAGECLVIDSEFFIKTTSATKDFKAFSLVTTRFFLFPPTFSQDFDLHFFLLRKPILKLKKETVQRLKSIFEIISERQSSEQNGLTFFPRSLNKNILSHLSKAFCYEIFEQYRNELPFGKYGIKSSNKDNIVTRFLYLLREKIIFERNISYYAKALDITPQYLATVLKSITGLSTNQWMHIIIIEKAKHMLLTQKMNISQVAKALNYPDQSTFGKMFKSETGMSPIRFKKEVESN